MVKVLASMMTRERTRALTMAVDGADLASERFRIVCDLDPGSRHGTAARCIDVVTHDAPAGGEEVARERAAHDAEADDTDFALRHCQPPNALCPLIPAHSASLRAFTPVFDGLWTRVNALMLGIHNRLLRICDLGPRFGGDERM